MNRFGVWSCCLVAAVLIASCGKTTHKDGKPNIVEAMRADPLITQLAIPNATPQNVVASGGGGNGPGGSVAKASRLWNFKASSDRDVTTIGVLDQLHGLGVRVDKFICAQTNFAQGVKIVSDQSVDVLVSIDTQKVQVDLSTDGTYPPDRLEKTSLQEVSAACPEQLKQAARAVNQPRTNT